MTTMHVSDNFFSAGETTIYNEDKKEIGSLDLQSAFNSNVNILNIDGEVLVKARFPAFSNKWTIVDYADRELGVLKQNFTFFSKKFEYLTSERGSYTVVGEAFSTEFEIKADGSDAIVGHFKRESGFFSSPSYEVKNLSDNLSDEEMLALVMGVNMLLKRKRRNSGR
ncbi:hypothetical protein [Alteribacter aurantiacus]|uniref:hypothetical protein n=1 Tax=Alteribacter aurantiacus TaxID=254410 RepID=UPI00042821F7|nr:hypothetical protein [Alteribacter aurantiacus]